MSSTAYFLAEIDLDAPKRNQLTAPCASALWLAANTAVEHHTCLVVVLCFIHSKSLHSEPSTSIGPTCQEILSLSCQCYAITSAASRVLAVSVYPLGVTSSVSDCFTSTFGSTHSASSTALLFSYLDMQDSFLEICESINVLRKEYSLPLVSLSPLQATSPLSSSGLSQVSSQIQRSTSFSSSGAMIPLSSPQYKLVAIGGTFDRLHAGHKLLLTACALSVAAGGELILAIADGPLLSKKAFKELIQDFHTRSSIASQFVRYLNPHIHVNIVQLTDRLGPAPFRADLEALIVSQETVGGGSDINTIREQNGLPKLDIVLVPLVVPCPPNGSSSSVSESDFKISSTAYREMDAASSSAAASSSSSE